MRSFPVCHFIGFTLLCCAFHMNFDVTCTWHLFGYPLTQTIAEDPCKWEVPGSAFAWVGVQRISSVSYASL